MDSKEALNKARVFATNAYAAKYNATARTLPKSIKSLRNLAAAKGRIHSGNTMHEIAGVYGHFINELVIAKLQGLLEGCELYNVEIDDDLATNFLIEVVGVRNALKEQVIQDVKATPGGMTAVELFPDELETNIPFGMHAIRVEIDRRRLMTKKSTATTVYHVQGDNARINVNSTDNSVNAVTVSHDQVFANLRQKITNGVSSGDVQNAILEKLTALEQAQKTPSFVQRYTEFIAVASNHMELIAPFIPALTEMFHKAL